MKYLVFFTNIDEYNTCKRYAKNLTIYWPTLNDEDIISTKYGTYLYLVLDTKNAIIGYTSLDKINDIIELYKTDSKYLSVSDFLSLKYDTINNIKIDERGMLFEHWFFVSKDELQKMKPFI